MIAPAALLLCWIVGPSSPGQGAELEKPAPAITATQIVERLVAENRERERRLEHYTGKRHYHIEYRGFPSNREATLDAEIIFDAPSTKSFRIVSESGSKMLADRVLRRLMDSEKEAATDSGKTALTPANYSFELDGMEDATQADGGRAQPAPGRAYVLRVQPRMDNKFLYRGKIWVDATDFAVTRIDAEPARNPSFWIKKTEIHHRYAKVGEFWLPQQNRTETRTRFGGTANLTIDYTDYQVGPARRH